MESCVVRFDAFNPRRNLPPANSRKRAESNFVGAFERHFVSNRAVRGVGARHFPMSGYGIADFVWIDAEQTTPAAASMLAFEMKMRDWRRALRQAFRYSYFADESIVVLPPDVAEKAAAHSDVFQKLGIGLWGFNAKTNTIQKHVESGTSQARNEKARETAFGLFKRKTKFRHIVERPDSSLKRG